MFDSFAPRASFRSFLTAFGRIAALAAVLAFGSSLGHDAVHVDHSAQCKVCHVKQLDASVLLTVVAIALFSPVLFWLVMVRPSDIYSIDSSVRSGRAPPVRLA